MEMPDTAGNPARIALLKVFNWRRVATINQAVEAVHTPVSTCIGNINATVSLNVYPRGMKCCKISEFQLIN